MFSFVFVVTRCSLLFDGRCLVFIVYLCCCLLLLVVVAWCSPLIVDVVCTCSFGALGALVACWLVDVLVPLFLVC